MTSLAENSMHPGVSALFCVHIKSSLFYNYSNFKKRRDPTEAGSRCPVDYFSFFFQKKRDIYKYICHSTKTTEMVYGSKSSETGMTLSLVWWASLSRYGVGFPLWQDALLLYCYGIQSFFFFELWDILLQVEGAPTLLDSFSLSLVPFRPAELFGIASTICLILTAFSLGTLRFFS